MNRFFASYQAALDFATARARELGKPLGICATNEYGKAGFTVRMLPERPKDRYGWERSAEVVEPA